MSSTPASRKAPRARAKRAAWAFLSPPSHVTPPTVDATSTTTAAVTCVEEDHPTGPVVHADSRVLLCGTFPPVKKPIHFYYPNASNDMWRILGQVFYDDARHFYMADVSEATAGAGGPSTVIRTSRLLDEDAIRRFAGREAIGFFDVCKRIRRHRGNSSDDNLEVLLRTDVIHDVLVHTPRCEAIITTGTLALTMLIDALHGVGSFASADGVAVQAAALNRMGKVKYNIPRVGGRLRWTPAADSPFNGPLWIYRAPSTSRALPLPLSEKTALYRSMLAAHLESVNNSF